MNKSEFLPLLIIIALLAIIYLVMRHINKNARSRLSGRKRSWRFRR